MNPHDFIITTIREAGALLLEKCDAGFETLAKGGDPRNIVTSVDREVNAFIIQKIQAIFPNDRIHSEESVGSEGESIRQWTIDPIDGSSNFSRGIPHFAVCIGVLENGVPITGGIYNPVTNELFSFEKGKGAFLNGKPIHVSETTELKDAFVLFHAGRKESLIEWGGESYKRLIVNVKKTTNLASSSLDACFVAAGRAEANVYGTLTTLDIAPALALLKEAGGVISTGEGKTPELSTEKQKIYMANNSTMLESVRNLLET